MVSLLLSITQMTNDGAESGSQDEAMDLVLTLLLFYCLLGIMFRIHVSIFFFLIFAIIVDYDLWL